MAAPKRIGELLIEAGVLTAEQLEQALIAQRKDGRKLGHLLIELGYVGESVLTQALSRQLSVPWVSLFHVDFSRSLLNLIPRELAEKFSLVPIFVRRVRKQGDTLYVAMDDPTNEAALAEVSSTAGIPVRPMIASPSDIRSAIRVYYLGGEATAATAPLAPPPSTAVPSAAMPPTRRETRQDVPPPPSRPVEAPVVAREEAAAREEIEAEEAPPSSGATPSDDSPHASPEIEATEVVRQLRPRGGPKMVALTLLDGTTIQLPATKRKSRPDPEEASEVRSATDQFTARDLISALRAVSHGADAAEILGERPPGWEAMFSSLLSLLLKKGLIADWEFIEEFRKI